MVIFSPIRGIGEKPSPLGKDISMLAVPNYIDPAMAFTIPQANILTEFLVKLSPSGNSSLL